MKALLFLLALFCASTLHAEPPSPPLVIDAKMDPAAPAEDAPTGDQDEADNDGVADGPSPLFVALAGGGGAAAGLLLSVGGVFGVAAVMVYVVQPIIGAAALQELMAGPLAFVIAFGPPLLFAGLGAFLATWPLLGVVKAAFAGLAGAGGLVLGVFGGIAAGFVVGLVAGLIVFMASSSSDRTENAALTLGISLLIGLAVGPALGATLGAAGGGFGLALLEE